MPIEIVPFESKHVPAVQAFNERMRAGGSKWGFYTDPNPDWIPHHDGAKSWREYHLAVEEDGTVRGGYALKPQLWEIRGSSEWVTDWQGPFTEADIDPRYSPLMLKMLRGMLKKHPLLFSLGHGGTEEPIVELLRKMRWDLHGVPFCLHIAHPFRFLRRNAYLRKTPLRRLALDLLAFTGTGWLGIKLLHGLLRLLNRPATPTGGAVAEVVPSFGPWADELWEAHRGDYLCLAVRDRAMMNALMPEQGWPGGTRLKITLDGAVIGWSVVHWKAMRGDPRFGDLTVGLITDCFGAPDQAGRIIRATHDYLASQNVDLSFANICHPAWVSATKALGYVVLPDQRLFAVSPALQSKLDPYEEVGQGLHLTNMDGHGPHGFQ
ncbi:MAG: hypothetical protein CMD39_08635 [Gammaproteobacteria bacterium]|nr:hypothetical protein [Gammaproteobacteria bacterium]